MTQARKPIEIVLTGGPCSGKTTSMRYLVEHLTARGWRALVVPEAATLLITGGLNDIGHFAVHQRDAYLAIQENLVLLQDDLRRRFTALAEEIADATYHCATACDDDCDALCHQTHQSVHERDHDPDTCEAVNPKVVLLHDRAILDNRAYMNSEEFTAVVRHALEATPGEVAARYDAVIHLVTAADGAVEHYTTANNEARTETVEQAIELDRAVQNAWLGHSHFNVVGNEGSFDQKLTRILTTVLNILGEPEPVEIERKWLLAEAPDPALLAHTVPVDIEQIYLPPTVDGTERRIRARTHDGHTAYFHTTKRATDDTMGRVEHEVGITADTYRLLAAMQDPATQIVHKRRYCFAHAGQHFELDHLLAPVDVWLLEAELVTAADTVTLPPDLLVAGEVTDDPTWRNSALARTGKKPKGAPVAAG